MDDYIVKHGDSLWKIARRHGTTVDILAHTNHLKGKQVHDLKIGQRLRLLGNSTDSPDSLLTLQFRALDFGQFTPKKVKVEHDGASSLYDMASLKSLALTVSDHAKGLKVWLEDLDKQMVQVLDEPILPIGKWDIAIDSRKVKIAGNLLLEKGKQETATPEVKKTLTESAQATNGKTAQEQTRTEQGQPIHALATIYTSENLRLLPGNEKYRAMLIGSAKRHGQTPQALAAMLEAEAAKMRDGTWSERSNENSPSLAQGLAQFFPAAWTGVFEDKESLLYKDCQNLAPSVRLSKRLEAKYAIDGAASYAKSNIKSFAKSTHFAVDPLTSEDKAKLAYLLHHEGLSGAKRLFGIGDRLTNEEARNRLLSQIGRNKGDQVDRLILQYGNNAFSAYKGWLFNYIDKKISVASYLVQDAKKFAQPPRTMAAIAAGLVGGPVTAAPAAKPSSSSSSSTLRPLTTSRSPGDSTHSTTAPVPPTTNTTTTSENDMAEWFDPLESCMLRSAGLSSGVAAAKFGMTRNHGTRAHQGIDLVAVPGTPIYAVANGTVRVATGGNYGKTLILEVGINDLPAKLAAHFREVNPGNTTIGFFYAHLKEYSFTPTNEPLKVNAGFLLGKTGCTGNADGMDTIQKGAHLHFEVRKIARLRCTGLTNRLDPLPFIQNCVNK
jgi:murein DD-endopeptidase MepM/ murein hydrolase activator NlpD